MLNNILRIAVVFAFALCAAVAVAADKYPNKPIRIIVPSAPSSGPDVIARLAGARFTEAWGEQVVADSRPGSAGNIAAELASRAAPDGYTLLVGTSQQISSPLLLEKVPFDLIRDFAPICLIATASYVLVVHPTVPAASVKEFIALAKSKPGGINYGSSGMGGAPHLAVEMLNAMAGLKLVHVPYKSVMFALVDLMGGQVQMTISVLPAALPMIRQGKLRALGVTSLKRTSLAPDLEPIAATVPGYEMIGWYGLNAPNKTPAKIIAQLNAETNKAINTPEFQEKLQALGADVVGGTPQAFTAFMTEQREKIRRIIEIGGLRGK
ncbi:MAG: tripartite tricarboxylate transporter substrate binding protein [Betaproteobacteria bacterium]|nr:tripartite tricarboxylate transporter substrate binding protein [Betaproteobacteria bacterium]